MYKCADTAVLLHHQRQRAAPVEEESREDRELPDKKRTADSAACRTEGRTNKKRCYVSDAQAVQLR